METKNTILIVDDDTSSLAKLTDLLKPEYKIYAVKDGASALEKAEESLPDLILLDLIMPEINGLEVLSRLKSSERTKDIPVIFVTGVTDSNVEIKGLEGGAVDYICKPLNETIVKLRVRQQIQLINQLRKIDHLSSIDQLTLLPNRRSFDDRLEEEWDRASREQTAMSVLVVDIDHFKNYNDTYGHHQGDAALYEISKLFDQALKRPGDFVARWGGEEFIVLLSNTDSRGAYDVAEQIRRLAESLEIPAQDGQPTKLTLSIGISTRVQGHGGTTAELISRADTALNNAKSKGRNRVSYFELFYKKKLRGKNDTKKKIVFVIDDNDTNLTVAEDALSTQYRVIALSSAAKMFTALEKFKPDLILLDVEMPEMSGFEAMRRLKSSDAYAEIPVIFLTGLDDVASEAHGIELGAVDFIMKPFSKPVLLNRIKNHLNIDELVRERTWQLNQRTDQLARRTEQLVRLQNGIVFTLANVVENRDSNTGGHIERTSVYVQILIDAMMVRGVYSGEMSEWDLDSVVSSARLHDLGKIAIPDSILNKPDKLTDEEFAVIKTHTQAGERIIDQMMERTGDTDFLVNAKLFAAYHHEKWDGTGYPYGLKETDIPLHGRIMAVIDVYDALVSKRPYKNAFTHDKAVDIILGDASRHFDPLIATLFSEISSQVKEARDKLPLDV